MADSPEGDSTFCQHRYHKDLDGGFTCDLCGENFRTESTPGALHVDLRNSPGAIAERRRRATDRWTTAVSRVIRFIVPWNL